MFKYKNVLISVYDKTNLDVFANFLIKKKFKFQIISKSKKNVLRGLHLQLKK